MSCKYKYKDNWYSKDEIKEILLKEKGINSKGELIKPTITNNPKQPKLTKVNTTSIESVKSKVLKKDIISHEVINKDRIRWLEENSIDGKYEEDSKNKWEKIEGRWYKVGEFGQNETLPSYTSQAEINLKIAALKEVARKYPRSLITSKVVPINPNMVNNSEIQYSKVGSKQDIEQFKSWVDGFNRDNQKLNSNIQIFSDNNKGNFDSSSLKDDDLALMLFNQASGANVKSIDEITFDHIQYDTSKKDFAFFGGFSLDRNPSLSEVLNQTGIYPKHIMFIGESKIYPNFYEILEKQNEVIENSVKENFDKIFSFGFISSVFDQIKKELNNSKSETFGFETSDGKTFKFPKRFVKGFYKLTSKISQISEENRQNVLDAKVKQIIKNKRETNEKGIKPIIVKEFYNDGSVDILKYAIELIGNPVIKDAVEKAKNIKVVVFSNKEFSLENTAVWYQPNTNSIYIYEENLRIDKGAFQLLAHELIHGVTHLAINYDTSFKNEIRKLLKEVNNKTGKKYQKDNQDSIYGLKDEHEFLSEAFSNPLFKQLLESVEEEKETSLSLWQKFINAIFNLFNKDSKYKTETYKISTLDKLNSIIQINNFKFYNVSDINNNSRLTSFIPQKSQERLNQIQEIFNENPELSKYGTYKQFRDFITSISSIEIENNQENNELTPLNFSDKYLDISDNLPKDNNNSLCK